MPLLDLAFRVSHLVCILRGFVGPMMLMIFSLCGHIGSFLKFALLFTLCLLRWRYRLADCNELKHVSTKTISGSDWQL